MNGDVWKTLDWKNSELQGNYNSETDNIKIRHGKKDGIAYIFVPRIHFIKRMIDRILYLK